MPYEVFMVLGATVDDSGKRQEDIVVRFLEIIVAVFHNDERDVRLGTITRVVIRSRDLGNDVLQALSKPLSSGYSYANRC